MIVHLFVTDNCNLNCDYCYVSGLRNRVDFDLNSTNDLIMFIKKALAQNNSKKLIVDFFGGEPLLNINGISNIITKLQDNIDVTQTYILTTNGTLLTQRILEYLREKKFVLSISLDGSPESHDLHRKYADGTTSWKSIEKNIELLLRIIPNATARMTFDSNTVTNLYRNVIFLADRGFKSIKPIPDYFDNGWNDENFLVLADQFHKIIEYKKGNKILRIPLVKDKLVFQSDCTGGQSTFSISTNGDVFPCNYVVGEEEYKLGNINDIDNLKFRSYCIDKESRSECKGCSYFEACSSARCLFMNYRMTKDVSKPNGFFCAYERLQNSYVPTLGIN